MKNRFYFGRCLNCWKKFFRVVGGVGDGVEAARGGMAAAIVGVGGARLAVSGARLDNGAAR